MSIENLVPEKFGPLQGVKIVSTGTLIAQPFAAELAAEMGAEVIQIERPGIGDVGWRNIGIRLKTKDGKSAVATTWIQERRNVFCVTLDLSKPRGREIFLKLIARADIWMESSKPGTYQKWGLDDASMWKVNPKLVITHVSGFGQSGDPDYVHRASYDVVGQAVGGTMIQTGFPDPTPPTRAAPWTGDYMTALFTMWSSLAGLTYARATGKGQSIDVAQYEAIHKTLGGTMVEYFQNGIVRERSGNRAQGFQPLDTFQASDGWVVMGALGDVYSTHAARHRTRSRRPEMGNGAHATRIDRRNRVRRDSARMDFRAHREGSRDRDGGRQRAVLADHVEQGHRRGSAIPRARNARRMGRRAGGQVKGIGVAPKFSLTPGKIVRGSVPIGHDNDRVYREMLGVSADDLESLRREKII